MRRVLMTTVALAGLAACSAPFVGAPENGQAAVYVLTQVDERPLPYLHGAGSSIAQQELTEGMIQLRADGTFYLDLTYMVYSPSGPRRSGRAYEGMWTRVGDWIDFEFDNGVIERAEVVRGVINLPIEGRVYSWEQ